MQTAILPPNVTTLAVAGVGLFVLYRFLIYPFFSSPLRHVPRAHWSVPIPYLGSLWILYQRYQLRNNAVTYQAHLKLGPVVRLGDNEISVNCYEGGLKTIYAGGWEKHEWYPRQFANFGVMNMFSTVGHHAHAQKKRIMANIYSKSFLQTSAQVQANSQQLICKRFLPLIASLGETSEAVDIHEVNNAFTMDMMTAYQFGISRSTNFTQNIEVRRKYLQLYHSRRNWQFVSAEVPPFLRKFLQTIGVSLYPPSIHRANEWLEEWSRSMCDATEKHLRLLEGASTNPGDEPIVFKQYKNGLTTLRQRDPFAGHEVHTHLDEGMNFSRGVTTKLAVAPDEHATLLEVYSDMVDQLAAGHETSGVALTYMYYELSRNPALQEKLHAELMTLRPPILWTSSSTDLIDLPTAKDLDKLPFLHALLMETLRLHAPIPGMQPRISPNVKGAIPEVFPKPEMFNPHRWLTSSEKQIKEMNRHFWAFGSGGRMCIGSHLAMQEMKLIIAAVFTNYMTRIVDDEGIEEMDAYTTRPTSGKLTINFTRR